RAPGPLGLVIRRDVYWIVASPAHGNHRRVYGRLVGTRLDLGSHHSVCRHIGCDGRLWLHVLWQNTNGCRAAALSPHRTNPPWRCCKRSRTRLAVEFQPSMDSHSRRLWWTVAYFVVDDVQTVLRVAKCML